MPVGPQTLPPIVPPAQAATVPQLLDAIYNRLAFYLNHKDRVYEWDASLSGAPMVQSEEYETISIIQVRPRASDGAGRWGWKADVTVSVGIWTRSDTDKSGTHKAWNRKHWPRVFLAMNALAGNMLYSAYDDQVGGRGDAKGPSISGVMDLMDGADLNKVEDRTGYGFTEIRFQTWIILPIDPHHLGVYVG